MVIVGVIRIENTRNHGSMNTRILLNLKSRFQTDNVFFGLIQFLEIQFSQERERKECLAPGVACPASALKQTDLFTA